MDIYLTASWLGKYLSLVYTKTVDSVEGARWLVRQTPNILYYSPPLRWIIVNLNHLHVGE